MSEDLAILRLRVSRLLHKHEDCALDSSQSAVDYGVACCPECGGRRPPKPDNAKVKHVVGCEWKALMDECAA